MQAIQSKAQTILSEIADTKHQFGLVLLAECPAERQAHSVTTLFRGNKGRTREQVASGRRALGGFSARPYQSACGGQGGEGR